MSNLSKLRRYVREAPEVVEAGWENCDLCGEPIPPEHRHLLNVSSREVVCSCQACSILFHQDGAGEHRLIPDRRLYLEGFEMSEAQWGSLQIPVNMAFLFHGTPEGRVMAFYPSPAGPTESTLKMETWAELEEATPVLGSLQPDVEALLVNRVRGAREHFIVPIDECYRLVGIIRAYWRGLSGGQEVWREIDAFFEELRGRSRVPKEMRSTKEAKGETSPDA